MKILSNPNLSDEFIPTLNYSYYKSNGQFINKIDQNHSLLNCRYFEHNDEHDDDVTNEDEDDNDMEDSNRMHTTTSTSINTNNIYNHSNNNQVIIEEIWKACLRQHMIHPQRLFYIQQELKTIESIQNYHESFYIESSYHESSYFESLHERIVSLGRFILMEVSIMFGLHYIINDYITYPEYSNMSTLQFFVIDIQKIYEWAIIGYSSSINDNYNNNNSSSSNDVMGDGDRNNHNIVDDSSNDDNDNNNSYSSLKQSIEKILKINLKIFIQSLLQPSTYKINKIQLTQNILYINNVCHCLNSIVLLLIDRKIKTMVGPNQILYNLFDDYDINNDHNDDSISNNNINRNTKRNIDDDDDDDRIMNKVVYDLIDEIKLELFSYKHEISCLLQITTILKELLLFCISSSSSSSFIFNFSSLLINSDSNSVHNYNSSVIGSSDDYDTNNTTQLSSFYQYIHQKKLYFSTHLCYLPSLLRGELIIEELKNKLKNSTESSSFSNYDDDDDKNMKWHQNFIEIKNNNKVTYNSNDQIQLLENSLYDMFLLPFKIIKIQILKKKQQLKNKFISSGNNRNNSKARKDISVQISQSIVLYYLLDFFYLSIINNHHHNHHQLLPQLKNFIINLGNCFHLHPKIINSIFTIWQIDVTFDVDKAIENILLSSSSSSSITTTSTILQDIDILTAIIKRLLCSNQLLSCHHLISCLTVQQHPFIYSNIGILAKVSCIYRVDLWQVR